MTTQPTMTPADFAQKWKGSTATEKAASQEHFIDLCRMLGEPTPNEADPTGEHYAFEKRVTEASASPRYPNIQTSPLWLPVALHGLLQTVGPLGNELTIGSVDGLVAELERVHDHTVRLDEASLEAAARERAQPMILDY